MKTLMMVTLVACCLCGCAQTREQKLSYVSKGPGGQEEGIKWYKKGGLFVPLAPQPCEAISQASIPATPKRKHEVEFSDPQGLFNLGSASVYYYHREGTYDDHSRSWGPGGAYKYDRQEPYNETTLSVTPNPYIYTAPPREFWEDSTKSSFTVRVSPAPKQQCPKPEKSGKKCATGDKIILQPVR